MLSIHVGSRYHFRTMVLGVCGLLSPCLARGDDGKTNFRLAEIVPPTCAAYIEVTDAAGLLERLMAPEYRGIVVDLEALAEPDPRKQWGELVAGVTFVASQLGTTPEQLVRKLASKGGAVAIEGPDRLGGWIQSRDADVLRKTHDLVLDLARQDARTKGGEGPKTEEHAGVTYYRFDEKLTHAIVGDRLVFATSAEMLRTILDRLNGPVGAAETLAAVSTFRAVDEERPKDCWAWAYVSLERLRELDPKVFQSKPEDEAGQKLLFGPWIESLRAGKWAALSVGPDGAGWSAQLMMDRPGGESMELYAGFVPPPTSGAAPLLRPEGTLMTVSLYRDLEAVWDARATLLPAESQAGLAQLDTFAGQFFGGRDFATGVLGSLTANWRFVVVQQDHEAIDPTPGTRLPGFAVVLGLKPDDEEFAVRLQSAFQSFVGLVNLGAAQQKAPPLMLGTVEHDSFTIATAAYVAPKGARDGDADIRFNFSPSAARVGNSFVIASSIQTAKVLVPLLSAESQSGGDSGPTLVAEAEGREAARLIARNVGALRMNRMLEKGKDREAAEADVAAMGRLVEALGKVRLEVRDEPNTVRVRATAGH